MLDCIPTSSEMTDLLGSQLYKVWLELSQRIEQKYGIVAIWNKGQKAWKYEYKYRKSSKTLCAFYAKEHCFGFMIIFGKTERKKFETDRSSYSKEVQDIYDTATTYHDGKWMMFELKDTSLLDDMEKLLLIKRRPS